MNLIAASSSRRRSADEDEHEVAIGMEPEFDDVILKGLHRYVSLVIEALGLHGDACCVQLEPIASAYIALERRLPNRPDRDVALLWDERHGWALGVETSSGEDLIVIGYQGLELLPPPRAVATFAESLYSDEATALLEPPPLGAAESEDGLALRLAAYAGLSPHAR
ncbi:hypothetical protein DL991_12855 [Amycolatopsis sp. WAC 01375]|uniref:DUF6292 family protein n=1 Tax=Amycolatopsis sp. WAC 01375 TaxID=2203194 RepID=UPI000F794D3C|nr:DUF6292 family protein [Amycolatopsis sp. WAC 01375]RSM79693.1 hypothetical protein DL991_12855 [Amycolatopsis sp. WAC 01375]